MPDNGDDRTGSDKRDRKKMDNLSSRSCEEVQNGSSARNRGTAVCALRGKVEVEVEPVGRTSNLHPGELSRSRAPLPAHDSPIPCPFMS